VASLAGCDAAAVSSGRGPSQQVALIRVLSIKGRQLSAKPVAVSDVHRLGLLEKSE